MKVEEGKTCYFRGRRYKSGDELPADYEEHLKVSASKKPAGKPVKTVNSSDKS